MDHLVFDTRYTGDGFCFESAEFPQGNVMAALGWSRAPGRRPSCALGLSDRRGCCSSFASLVVDAGGSRARARALPRCRRFAT